MFRENTTLPLASPSTVSGQDHTPQVRLVSGRWAGTWPEEMVGELKSMWAGGLSSRRIAAELNSKFGCDLTRNAVLGKVDRLDLPRRPPPPRREPVIKVRTKKIPPVVADMEIPADQRKTLLELEHNHCHWPVGDPQEPTFFFCGAIKTGEGPYCAHHTSRAYGYVSEYKPGPSRTARQFAA